MPHNDTLDTTPPRTTDTPYRRRAKWAIGSALVVLGISGLGVWGMRSPGAVSFFVTPSEVVAKGPDAPTTIFRLGGRVADGTLERTGPTVRFAVTDGDADVHVVYTGEVPDTLQEGTDVVAEGAIGPDGKLAATRVMAKCSSRFVPEAEAEARERAARH